MEQTIRRALRDEVLPQPVKSGAPSARAVHVPQPDRGNSLAARRTVIAENSSYF